MIDYGKAPNDQMQLGIQGLTDGGYELMEEARRWTALHFNEWCWYKKTAREECVNGAKASPNYVLNAMRHHFHISVKNAMAPCLARIAMEQDKSIQFRIARSRVDGFCDI